MPKKKDREKPFATNPHVKVMVKPKLPVASKPKVVKKPPTRVHLLCEEAMELVKDRIHLRLKVSGDGFTLINAQPQPWGYTMKGGYSERELVALIERIKETPARG